MAAISQPLLPTIERIYQAYRIKADNGWRQHLGASVIGRECDRELWSIFRWVTIADHEGRILRLFDTGNHEEPRFVRDIRATGAICMDVDPETGRQWRVSAHGGHFGGSMDAAIHGLIEAPATWHVGEFKTHNDKSFQRLKKDGVEKAKPEHFIQMQIYMHLTEMRRAFYLAVNKNTDELYGERIRYDKELSDRVMEKAGRIINSATPPTRMSDDPSFYKCKWCDHWENCHGGQLPARNCRTCMHSTPAHDGTWLCEHGKEPVEIGLQLQMEGCTKHRFIPQLVTGEQTDIDGEDIIYELRNGELYTDRGQRD